jgi:hypothetical protein
MTRLRSFLRRGTGRTGATLVFVALSMVVLLGVAALAIDVGYAYVIRGELQNAADSGALAGAQVLYANNGTAVNPGANAEAADYATRHLSEQATVEVESVTRGHWSFGLGALAKGFYPNEGTLEPVPLWNVTTEALDANVNFINAVQVITRRSTDASGQLRQPFFAAVFGGAAPMVRTTAVAYIGFAGTLEEGVADQPIAICEEAILQNDMYTCSVGRMLNSDNNTDPYSGTGGWTNLTQPCSGASNANEMRQLVCGDGNAEALLYGDPMSTVGGVQDNVFRDLKECWEGTGSIDTVLVNGSQGQDGIPDQPWALTLPVIQCPQNNVTSCSTLIGAVVVNVVWIIRDNNPLGPMTPRPEDTPHRMADWYCDPATNTDTECWTSFTDHFNLLAPDLSPAIASAKTVYFLPDCAPHTPVGGTGGENYGVLARIPVLVR